MSIKKICNDFGLRVVRRREELGLTQRQVIEVVGNHKNTGWLSLIENGTSLPSLEYFIALAIALRMTPNQLLNYASWGEEHGEK